MWWGTPRDSTTGRMRAETNAARVTHQIARNEETPNQKTNGMLKFHGRGVCQSEFAFSRVFPPPCPPGIVRSHLRIRGSSAGLRPRRVSANRPDHVRLHLRRAPSSVFFPWLVGARRGRRCAQSAVAGQHGTFAQGAKWLARSDADRPQNVQTLGLGLCASPRAC